MTTHVILAIAMAAAMTAAISAAFSAVAAWFAVRTLLWTLRNPSEEEAREQGRRIAEKIKQSVAQELMHRQRPGGLLGSLQMPPEGGATRSSQCGESPASSDHRNVSLAAEWERRARRKFLDADQEKDQGAKRFIEHGALCYLNCARELRTAQAGHEQPAPETPSGDRG